MPICNSFSLQKWSSAHFQFLFWGAIAVKLYELCIFWKLSPCWERLKAGGEGDDRGWDGWMASPTQWTRIWASSRSWWWTGKPGMLQPMGSQRVGHDWATELNWSPCCSHEILLYKQVCLHLSLTYLYVKFSLQQHCLMADGLYPKVPIWGVPGNFATQVSCLVPEYLWKDTFLDCASQYF